MGAAGMYDRVETQPGMGDLLADPSAPALLETLEVDVDALNHAGANKDLKQWMYAYRGVTGVRTFTLRFDYLGRSAGCKAYHQIFVAFWSSSYCFSFAQVSARSKFSRRSEKF
eukprot:894074-Pelagomonas_calceolata.AAC.6